MRDGLCVLNTHRCSTMHTVAAVGADSSPRSNPDYHSNQIDLRLKYTPRGPWSCGLRFWIVLISDIDQ